MAGGFRSNRSFARSTVSSSLGNDFPCLFPPPFAPLRRFFRLRGPVAPFFDALEFEEAESFLGFLSELTVPSQREEVHESVGSNPCRLLANMSYPRSRRGRGINHSNIPTIFQCIWSFHNILQTALDRANQFPSLMIYTESTSLSDSGHDTMTPSPSGDSCGINSNTFFESRLEIHCAQRLQVEQNPSKRTMGTQLHLQAIPGSSGRLVRAFPATSSPSPAR